MAFWLPFIFISFFVIPFFSPFGFMVIPIGLMLAFMVILLAVIGDYLDDKFRRSGEDKPKEIKPIKGKIIGNKILWFLLSVVVAFFVVIYPLI